MNKLLTTIAGDILLKPHAEDTNGVLENIEPKQIGSWKTSVPYSQIWEVKNCQRCQGDHDNLVFYRFRVPVAIADIWVADMWATCPVTYEPILGLVGPAPVMDMTTPVAPKENP